ncbi:MAG: Lon family ATP-dependent protease [Selenomonas sp.]|nr:Lon family ATP-dependent protease [Selenomonas sp.]MCI7330830.1 Lon family ATP-dependent protease [Selenomonadaceae bacterium]MDD6119408.1 Lon family ATP-dependent protease [Selenomonadaceae bacterium]MDD7055742.1 Lon family ATP-dependent protease [Selenomonadaceae bacterium]MDY3916666.1 Lon family ATP-dependent protease [Selenomonadaceae bacterium]
MQSQLQVQQPESLLLDKEIDALYGLLEDMLGREKLVLNAGRMQSLYLMRSENRCERVLGLQRLILGDPLVAPVPQESQLPGIISELTDKLADMQVRRELRHNLEQKVNDRMEQEHQDYVRELKKEVFKEEHPKAESPQAASKRKKLDKLEKIHLTESVMDLLRPQSLAEIVGQEKAVKSLLAKLSSPYPQHLLLYGPPGVGKTTAARLVLEVARKKASSPFAEDAPFVETDGTTLSWDPRNTTNPLLGSVHDPIYQGAQRLLADSGVPEPKPGLVTDAHGGILFIDEIGEMDEMLQNKLLKVLEDKRMHFESSYYDPDNPKVPPYIRHLFEQGAPADFVLIGATTRDAQHINPALRSRCAEIYFEPLTPAQIETIVRQAAAKLKVTLTDEVTKLIASYTIEGRKAVGILADAYSLALERVVDQLPDKVDARHLPENVEVTVDDVYEMARVARLTPYVTKKASHTAVQGHIFGLGVAGFIGSVIEIEAVAFPARSKGKGRVRFNDTAGSMAKDSVFNAASVLRQLTGKDIADYDVHINVIGGGNIDGPSAGTAILACIVSAVTGRRIWQDVAVTGEISLAGRVRPVGGVMEKAYGASQAGIRTMVIPQENAEDLAQGHLGLDIHPVETAEQAFAYIFADAEAPEHSEHKRKEKDGCH